MRAESNFRSNPKARPAAFGWLRTSVIPAKAGIQSGLRRVMKLLFDPIRPHRNGAPPTGPRGHVPVRGAWESACGWEARWNAWLASPSSPVWRGDGEQSLRR